MSHKLHIVRTTSPAGIVPHPDVFWYSLTGMGAQINSPKNVLAALFPYIYHVKTK